MVTSEQFEKQQGIEDTPVLDLSNLSAGQNSAEFLKCLKQMDESSLGAAASILDQLGLNKLVINFGATEKVSGANQGNETGELPTPSGPASVSEVGRTREPALGTPSPEPDVQRIPAPEAKSDRLREADRHQKPALPPNFGSLVEISALDITEGRFDPVINALRSAIPEGQREAFIKQVNEKLASTGVSIGFAVDKNGKADPSSLVIRRPEEGLYDDELQPRRMDKADTETYNNLRISMKDGSKSSDRTVTDLKTGIDLQKIEGKNLDPEKAAADILQWFKLKPSMEEAKKMFSAFGTPEGDKALDSVLNKAYEKFGMPGVYHALAGLNKQYKQHRSLEPGVKDAGPRFVLGNADEQGLPIMLFNKDSISTQHSLLTMHWSPKKKE